MYSVPLADDGVATLGSCKVQDKLSAGRAEEATFWLAEGSSVPDLPRAAPMPPIKARVIDYTVC